MPSWDHTFGTLSGNVPASFLDDNFNQAAFASDLAAVVSDIADLPSDTIPLVPVAGGSAGVASDLSRSDHQHPPQSASPNLQTGTSYTLQASDNGGVVEVQNAASITFTLPNNLAKGFSCLVVQTGAGQATFVAASGASFHTYLSTTKTAGQWAAVTLYIRANAGASAEYVLAGNMA